VPQTHVHKCKSAPGADTVYDHPVDTVSNDCAQIPPPSGNHALRWSGQYMCCRQRIFQMQRPLECRCRGIANDASVCATLLLERRQWITRWYRGWSRGWRSPRWRAPFPFWWCCTLMSTMPSKASQPLPPPPTTTMPQRKRDMGHHSGPSGPTYYGSRATNTVLGSFTVAP
jgi:hypothetical protein